MIEITHIYKSLIKILIIAINSFLFLSKFRNSYSNTINKYQKEFNYNLNETYSNKTLLFQKINEYIRLCKKKILINDIPKRRIKNPKISAVIPVYNASNTIISAVRSIQNQDMKEIEIILVDDCSPDNSSNTINQLMLEDKRIQLIKNKENKGTLYSRSIGALNAKGKYIMALDNDDLFIFGIFNKSYEEALKNDSDIIEFSGIQLCRNCSADKDNIYIPYYLRFKEDGLIVNQPELSKFIYIKTNNFYSYDFRDVFVWGKLIKTDVYQKAVNLLGDFIYNYTIFLTEDKIFTVALYKVANSFKFIDIYGIIYNENPNSICHSWLKSKKQRILQDFLLFAIIFFDLYKDSEEIQIVVEDLKIRAFEYNTFLEGKYKILLHELYRNILGSKKILESEKEIITKIINQSNITLNLTG